MSAATALTCVAVGAILGVVIGVWILVQIEKENRKGPWR